MAARELKARVGGGVAIAAVVLVGWGGCSKQDAVVSSEPGSRGVVATTQVAPASRPSATAPASQGEKGATTLTVTTMDRKPEAVIWVLGKVDGRQQARVVASLESHERLTIRTTNVAAMRINLSKLPRGRAGRVVLRLDGQGLEVTRGNRPIYLERSSVGTWSFGRESEKATPGPF